MHPQLINTYLDSKNADLILSNSWSTEWYWIMNGSVFLIGKYGSEIRAGSMSIEDAKITMPDHIPTMNLDKMTKDWTKEVGE